LRTCKNLAPTVEIADKVMDINDLRAILTVVIFFAFIGIWVWAWSKRRKADFDASAALPLEEDNYLVDNERENV